MTYSYVKSRLLIVSLIMLLAGSLQAGTTGSIAGTITDAKNGSTLKGALISVIDAGVYTVADKYGNFIITGLQPGTYQVQAKFIGYTTITYKKVQVKTDVTTRLTFDLNPTSIQAEPIFITGVRNPVQEEVTSTVHYISNQDLNAKLPADNYLDTFNYLPGIFSNHFRGSRTSDVLYLVDGMPIISALTRELAFDIPNSAIEEIAVYSGGFSAEYGNANAGVVNIVRKRARNHFEFSAKSYFDHFDIGSTGSDNNRRFQIGVGGPVTMSFGGPVLESNYFISLDGNFSDTPEGAPLRKAFDETVFKNLNGSFIYDIKVSKNVNLAFQTTISNWQWRQQEKNSLDPAETMPLRKNRHLSSSIGLTHFVSPSVFYQINLGYNRLHDAINGEVPDSLGAIIFSNNPVPTNAFNLDVMPWEQQISEDNYYLQSNIFKQFGRYLQFKAGFSAEYYDLSMQAEKLVLQTNQFEAAQNGQEYAYNRLVNDFHKFPFTLASYAETRIKLPFLVGQFGIRLDYLNPNVAVPAIDNSATDGTVTHKSFSTKLTFSPRIALTLPLTSSDVVYFNYGKYAQIPSFFHLYAGENLRLEDVPMLSLVGNPDLRPTETRQYELSYSKNFDKTTNWKITGYYRHYSDLLDSKVLKSEASAEPVFQFSNRASSRARGIEMQIAHTFSPRFSAQAIYSLMHATGTSNTPEENYYELVQTGGNFNESEGSLNWDQRHSFGLMAFANIGDFQLNAASRFYSPREWHTQTSTEKIAEKLPLRTLLDFKLFYRAGSKRMAFKPYIEVKNFFNVRYNEYRDTISLFGSQPTIPFQEQFGRRIRIGLQIN